MCLLTFYPEGILLETGALMNGAEFNNDGHGFAIVTQHHIIVWHCMDARLAVDTFARTRTKYPDGPAIFHSRFGTHGSVGLRNCHPFRVGGDARTVLAHNGILPSSVQPAKGDTRCDTRIAAEDFLPGSPFGSLGSRRNRERLARWLGPSNKLVVLTIDPRYRRNAYILNEESGIWDGGVWYSNSDYREPFIDSLDDYWCFECHTFEVDPVTGMCTECGACRDCGERPGHCFCYQPAKFPAPDEQDFLPSR
ncbi:hypothetical protein [Amycolatopsis pigmentata]|uniref:Glutamine amidotransferase n=1 Tax=Amycolatopsis pigmentata TaxID=450801 RepID=A0ABW5G6Y4_9PSEU